MIEEENPYDAIIAEAARKDEEYRPRFRFWRIITAMEPKFAIVFMRWHIRIYYGTRGFCVGWRV